jgi:hypothetical protein
MNRQKKMLLVLPILVLPFTTLLFWSLGGGSANATGLTATTKGLNTELPNANNKNLSTDKMSFYEVARRDSMDRAQALSMDPYNKAVEAGVPYDPYIISTIPQEAKLQATINQVEKLINQPAEQKKSKPVSDAFDIPTRMETTSTKDPELEQLSGMIDKIMEIQYPEKTKQKIPAATTIIAPSQNSFMTVAAVIPQSQVLVSGAVIRIRLMNELFVNDSTRLQAGVILYGITTLEGERLQVQVPSVRINNRIVTVNLLVYDSDGMQGIYIPGAITREVAKQSGDDAINSIDIGSLDPSLKAQVASAGIKAARSLLSRKIKLTRVTVPAGHQVYLQQKQ